MPLNEYDEMLSTGKPATANEYDSLVEDQRAGQKQVVQGSVYAASKTTPDRAAKVLDLSKKTKLPAEIVERNFDSLSQKAAQTTPDYDAIIDRSPALAKWLEDPSNAAVGRDDLERLAKIEHGARVVSRNELPVNGAVGFTGDLARSIGTGYSDLGAASWHLAAAYGLADPKEAAEVIATANANSRALRARMPDYAVEFQKTMKEEGGDVDKAFSRFMNGYEEHKKGNILRALQDYSIGGIKTIGEALDMVRAAAVRPRGLTYSVLESLAHSTPALVGGAAGAAAGAATGPFAPLAIPVGIGVGSWLGSAPVEIGSWINQALEKRGYDIASGADIARAYSDPKLMTEIRAEAERKGVTTATVDAIFNAFGGKVLAGAKGKGVVSKAVAGAKDIAVQAAGETISEGSGQLAATGTVDMGDALFEGIASLGHSVGDVAIGAASRGFFHKDPTKAVEEIADVTEKAIAAQRDAKALQELGAVVQELGASKTVPERIRQLIEIAGGDAGGTILFQASDWDEIFSKQGLSPAKAAAQIMGDEGRAYYDAKERRGSLEIKLGDLVEKVAVPSPEQFESLLPIARVRAKGMTLAEASEHLKDLPGLMSAVAQEATATPAEKAGESVVENIEQQLLAAGYDQKTAKTSAAILKGVEVLAKREGKDPAELFKKYGLRIRREMPGVLQEKGIDNLDVVLDRLRKGEVPKDADIYGESLVDFLRRSGGVRDDEGDFKSMDPDAALKPFQKKLIQEGGKPPDMAAGAAKEAGYLREHDINELYEAIDSELRGKPSYAPGNRNEALFAESESLSEFGRYLEEQGIDLSKMDNAAAKKALSEVVAKSEPVPDWVTEESPAEEDGVFAQAARKVADAFRGKKPTTNSEGRPIALAEKHVRAFWKWFGESKVIDGQGRPMVVYHWTQSEFEKFGVERGETKALPLGHMESQGAHFGTVEQAHGAGEFRRDGPGKAVDKERILPVYLSIKNPKRVEDVGNWIDPIKQAKAEGHDGLVYSNVFEGAGDSYVAFYPEQIKSAIGNRGTFDASKASILEQGATGPKDRDLIIQHNLTAANLLHSVKMGGIPVPSLAITKAGQPTEGFGEITLIGQKELADPKGYAGTKVFGSDIYSPRYPTVNYKVDHKRMRALAAKLDFKRVGESEYSIESEIDDKGPEHLENLAAVMAAFLDEKGIKWKPVKGQGRNGIGDISDYRTRSSLREIIEQNSLADDYRGFVAQMFNELDPQERIFMGFTDSGNRRYKPHTLENVVAILKKELRGGESSGNLYGVGQLRSKFTPQFRSVEAIRKAKDRLVPRAEFEKIKEEVNSEFFKIADSLAPYYGHERGFQYSDTVLAVMEEAPARGLAGALREYGFSDVPEDTQRAVVDFLEKLRELPTEYFEAKVLREVDLSEFKAAVVPEGTSKDAIDALEKRGVKIATYNKKDSADRARVVKATAEQFGEQVLFQQGDADKARGRLRFGNNRQFNIDLLKKADLSTFLHEMGHFYLEVVGDLATAADASEKIKADYTTLLKYVGAEPGKRITRDQHEKIARSFEAYLMEGKAPSAALRQAFANFRAWLVSIYREIKALNVELTDEVRGVFDRLLATEDEIAAAQSEAAMTPLFADPAALGMKPEEAARYQKAVDDARIAAEEQLAARVMAERARAEKPWWKAERDKVRSEITEEVNGRAVYIALAALQASKTPDGQPSPAGKVKLSKKSLVELYGSDFLKRLPKPYVYAKDGIAPDMAAEMFGFSSGDELVMALANAQPRVKLIEALTDERMKAEYGDILTDGRMAEEAMKVVHNEKRAELLRMELAHLAANDLPALKGMVRKITRPVPPLDAVRAQAETAISGRKVRDISPYVFQRSEMKAGNEAVEAMLKGDFEAAFDAKQRELINHEMYRAAVDARDRIEQAVDDGKRLQRDAVREKIGKAGSDYLDQIDKLLERFDFRRSVSLREVDKRKSTREWYEAQKEAGFDPYLPEYVLDDAYRKHFKDMTFEELVGVHDSLKAIEHLAKTKNRLLKDQRMRALDAAVDEAVASIEANSKGVRPRQIETRLPQDAAGRGIGGFFASHRKLASHVREMDGFKDGGVMWGLFSQPINDAGNAEAVANEKAAKTLIGIFDVYNMKDIATAMYRKQFIPEIKASLTRMGRIMVALNWGNDDNRQKLMAGYQWDEKQVEAILKTLDERDLGVVNAIWEYVDAYWPKTKEIATRVNGVAPEKVEAKPFKIGNVPMRGGYFRLKYDDRQEPKAYGHRVQEVADQIKRGAFMRATTKHGHREARVEGVKMPVRLDFGVIFEHVAEVIHDQTHYEMLLDVNRLLGDRRLQQAIIQHHGDIVYKQIQNALEDIATGDVVPLRDHERALNWIRSGASIAAMGWNVMTAVMQPLGITQSIVRIGPKWFGRGVARWLGDARRMENTVAAIHEKSDLMRLRSKTQMREISEIRNSLRLRGKALGAVEDSYFWLITRGQMIADVPTWLGAYEKAFAEMPADVQDSAAQEKHAVALADQTVLDAQGGGQVKDLAQVQRGHPAWKLWTNFYSFFNTTYNLTAESYGRTNFKDPAAVGYFAADMLMLYTVPAILGALLKSKLKGDDDDDLAEKMVREQLAYLMGTVMFARELGSFVQGFQGYDGPAGARIFSEAGKLAKQAEQGEADEAFARALNNVAGILFHYPAAQVDRTVRGMAAAVDGTAGPMAPLVGPPKK